MRAENSAHHQSNGHASLLRPALGGKFAPRKRLAPAAFFSVGRASSSAKGCNAFAVHIARMSHELDVMKMRKLTS